MKRFFDMLHAAAEQGYAGDRAEGLRDPSAVFGRGVPRLLRDRLEGWAMGRNCMELARILAYPESVATFRVSAKAEFDSEGWRKAIATLSRLGGRAVAQPTAERPATGRAVALDDDRTARASGGAVGAAKLSRAAEEARKEIAIATKPIMGLAD